MKQLVNEKILFDERAKKIYQAIKDLPLIDYHTHLSAKQIYENEVLEDIAVLFLSEDHYKFRLMRSAGIDEEKITGSATFEEKFVEFSTIISTAFNHPVYDFTKLELERLFNIKEQLNKDNALIVRTNINKMMKVDRLTPQKILSKLKVEYLATTDDPLDDLKYHQLLQQNLSCLVTPSFRADRLLDITSENFLHYFEQIKGKGKTNLDKYIAGIADRIDYFKLSKCKFIDIGLSYLFKFDMESDLSSYFDQILSKMKIENEKEELIKGYIFIKICQIAHQKGLIVQTHIGPLRNVNTIGKQTIGIDAGFDAMSNSFDLVQLANILDYLSKNKTLPKMIIFTINPIFYECICSLIYAFDNVTLGPAWWFNDHKEGIINHLKVISTYAHLSSFTGMVSDSRSLFSPLRHDYFRICLSLFLKDFEGEEVIELAKDICYFNPKRMVEDKGE